MPNVNVWAILFLLLLASTEATHFRGGMFSWVASPDDPKKVDISMRFSWRRTYRDNTFCNDTTIAEKKLVGPWDAPDVMCTKGCGGTVSITTAQFYCTDFSIIENWSAGIRTVPYTFPEKKAYEITWNGKGWIGTLKQGQDEQWSFFMLIDLSPRPDTGKTNSAPHTAMTPILSLKHGCTHTITIPKEDPDGDPVSCRWAATKKECGGICHNYDGIELNSGLCELQVSSSVASGLYGLAIQLEDHLPDSNTVLSSIPLQFLVEVNKSAEPCDNKVVFVPPTPEPGSCLLPSIGKATSFRIVADTGNKGTRLDKLIMARTYDMQRTPIYQVPGTSLWYINVTWTPMQLGEHIICFTATNSIGISSEQRCIYLSVDPNRPVPSDLRFHPVNRTISVKFDQSIYLPYSSSYISIYYKAQRSKLLIVDTKTSPNVRTIQNFLFIKIPVSLNLPPIIYLLFETDIGRTVCTKQPVGNCRNKYE